MNTLAQAKAHLDACQAELDKLYARKVAFQTSYIDTQAEDIWAIESQIREAEVKFYKAEDKFFELGGEL